MFFRTHITIANNVYENLKIEKNINLDKKLFICGNVSPDFLPDFINQHHYKELCYDKVKKCMQEIANTKMTIAQFSYKAGIICHYISDMFCYPHEQNWRFFEGSTIEHIKYESKQEVKTQNNIYIVDNSIFLKHVEDEYIDFFIHTLLDEYQKIVDYSNDVRFSVIACYKYIESSLMHMFRYNIITT